jgi:hypothetical protein
MIRRLHFATTAVLMIVTLAGCGGAGSDGTTSGASGTATESRGTGAAIADISIPLAEGADAVATSRSGPMTIVQYIVPLERQAATIAFYEQWTAASPGEQQRKKYEAQNRAFPSAQSLHVLLRSGFPGYWLAEPMLCLSSL